MRFASFFKHALTGGIPASVCGLLLASCGGAYGGGGINYNPSPGPSGSKMTQPVSLSLAFAPFTDATYGTVFGFMNGVVSSGTSQVIHLTAGANVIFYNTDTKPHTASFLGMASGSTYPHPFASVNSMGTSPSPAGTSIDTTNFSTGTINAGSISATYGAGAAGFDILGSSFDYDNANMRTVAVVQ